MGLRSPNVSEAALGQYVSCFIFFCFVFPLWAGPLGQIRMLSCLISFVSFLMLYLSPWVCGTMGGNDDDGIYRTDIDPSVVWGIREKRHFKKECKI